MSSPEFKLVEKPTMDDCSIMDELKSSGSCEARNKCFSLIFIEKQSYMMYEL